MLKVNVSDIPELRAYNAVRDGLRRDIIALKSRRRIQLGTLITLVFENTETVRWQICEMMRAERIATDAAIAHEVTVYNELVPGKLELSCTMFIELTDDEGMREWLPKLVGIHDAIEIVLADGFRIRGFDPRAQRLTRDEVTAAVHYLKFSFTPDQVIALRTGAVAIESVHSAYRERAELSDTQCNELATDLSTT